MTLLAQTKNYQFVTSSYWRSLFEKQSCKVIALSTARFRLEQNVNSGFFSCEFLGTDVKYYGESGRPSAGLIDCE